MKQSLLVFVIIVFHSSCKQQAKEARTSTSQPREPEAISLLGDSLYANQPSEKVLEKYQLHRLKYEKDSLNVENLIWFGRFTAYKVYYNEAIDIYTRGIKRFRDDPRLYRHRGHRYISIRKFDQAIRDLEYAVKLIEGTENRIEPDGMPNAQNIPVSSTHGNIWYHLGLAYYLKHDFENALKAYQQCLASTNNDDNLVSSTHWIYMILRRMQRPEEASTYLDAITDSLEVIENTAYHEACLFYKGAISLDELSAEVEEGASGDAIRYAIGNWHLYNGDREKARSIFESILSGPSWNSFGYIAAESDFALEFK